MALDIPTLVAANSASNDTDFDAWTAVVAALSAANAGQFQGGRNFVHNGAFDVWQRGTSFASGAAQPGPDRWQFRRGSSDVGATLTRAAGFSGARYCAKLQRDAGNALTTNVGISHNIETAEAARLAGKTCILSADMLVGTTFSDSAVRGRMAYGTGVDEVRVPTGNFATGASSVTLTTQSVSQAAARIVFPAFVVPAGTTEVGLDLYYTATGIAGANDYLSITNVQLECVDDALGVSTPFERRDFAEEMLRCERFLQKSFLYATTPAQNAGIGTGEALFQANTAGATSQRSPTIPLRSRMRVAPAVTLYNPAAASAHVRDETNSANCTASAATNISETGFAVTATGAAGTTVGAHLGVHWLASAEI